MARVSMSSGQPARGDGAAISTVIWGAGAIGQTVAAYTELADSDLTIVDVDEEQVAALAERGVRVTVGDAVITRHLNASTPESLAGSFDVAFVATKSQDIRSALPLLIPRMKPGGSICFFQNGIEKWDRYLAGSGLQAVYVAISDLHAVRDGHGGAIYSDGGHLHIGTDGEPRDPATLQRIADMLSAFETAVTANIFGFKWVKTAWGCMIIATALSDQTMANVLRDEATHDALAGVIAEVLAIAEADGVDVQALAHFNPEIFAGNRCDASGARRQEFLDIADFLAPLSKQHSGIWHDLHTFKKKTEVEAQFAPLFALARKHDVELVMLPRLLDAIRALEGGDKPDGNRLIVELVKKVDAA